MIIGVYPLFWASLEKRGVAFLGVFWAVFVSLFVFISHLSYLIILAGCAGAWCFSFYINFSWEAIGRRWNKQSDVQKILDGEANLTVPRRYTSRFFITSSWRHFCSAVFTLGRLEFGGRCTFFEGSLDVAKI